RDVSMRASRVPGHHHLNLAAEAADVHRTPEPARQAVALRGTRGGIAARRDPDEPPAWSEQPRGRSEHSIEQLEDALRGAETLTVGRIRNDERRLLRRRRRSCVA